MIFSPCGDNGNTPYVLARNVRTEGNQLERHPLKKQSDR